MKIFRKRYKIPKSDLVDAKDFKPMKIKDIVLSEAVNKRGHRAVTIKLDTSGHKLNPGESYVFFDATVRDLNRSYNGVNVGEDKILLYGFDSLTFKMKVGDRIVITNVLN